MRTVLDKLVWVALKERIEHNMTMEDVLPCFNHDIKPEQHLREILKDANLPLEKVNYWGLVLKGEAHQKNWY